MSGGLQDDLQGRCVFDSLSSSVDCRLRRSGVWYGNNNCNLYIARRGSFSISTPFFQRVDVGRVIWSPALSAWACNNPRMRESTAETLE